MPLNDIESHFYCGAILTPVPCKTMHEFTNIARRGPSAVAELFIVTHLSASKMALRPITYDQYGLRSHRSWDSDAQLQ